MVIDLNDPNHPRFTLTELRDVLHERNELKTKVTTLEEELQQYKPEYFLLSFFLSVWLAFFECVGDFGVFVDYSRILFLVTYSIISYGVEFCHLCLHLFIQLFICVLFLNRMANTEQGPELEEDPPVQGPINKEPDEKLYPERFSKESRIRKL